VNAREISRTFEKLGTLFVLRPKRSVEVSSLTTRFVAQPAQPFRTRRRQCFARASSSTARPSRRAALARRPCPPPRWRRRAREARLVRRLAEPPRADAIEGIGTAFRDAARPETPRGA
jgi:hypothetical protein